MKQQTAHLGSKKDKSQPKQGTSEPPFFLNQYRNRKQRVFDEIRQGFPVSVPNFYKRTEPATHRIGTHPAERERRNAPYPPCVRPVKTRHHRKFQDSRHSVLFATNRIQLPFHTQEQCHRQGALRGKRTQALYDNLIKSYERGPNEELSKNNTLLCWSIC